MNKVSVLLHGLGRTKISMAFLGTRLRRRGYRVLNFGYRSRHLTIAQQAERLHQYLSERVSPQDQLSFVTHSLGSIVMRKFAIEHGQHYVLQRAVMLGPPNQGSLLAQRVGRVPILRTIMGPALLELASLALEPATDRLEIGVIAGAAGHSRGLGPLVPGDNDGIVTLDETRLEGAKQHITIRGLHSFLMYKSEVIEQVLHFLEHGSFEGSVAQQ